MKFYRIKTVVAASCVFITSAIAADQATDTTTPSAGWAMAIHGGAGTITRDKMTPEKEAEIRAALAQALAVGSDVLERGGSALDAVTAAIRLLEDDPNFNAGKGAVFTHDGRNELDSAIMDGQNRNAGAVTGVTTVKNPILLARAVMEKSKHVMLAGAGAEAFADSQPIERVDPSYFHTDYRFGQLQDALAEEAANETPQSEAGFKKFGTVGAVALDLNGHMAAGTSTGGLTAKRFGRIGDTPIIGAGTYADDKSCAVSATGAGEYFIRANVAHSICAHVALAGQSLQEAANQVIHDDMAGLGGTGGVIALDPSGHIAFSFNTAGMYRGSAQQGKPAIVAIYGDENP